MAASLNQELAGQDYEIRRVELIARVANVFTEVLAGQEQSATCRGEPAAGAEGSEYGCKACSGRQGAPY